MFVSWRSVSAYVRKHLFFLSLVRCSVMRIIVSALRFCFFVSSCCPELFSLRMYLFYVSFYRRPLRSVVRMVMYDCHCPFFYSYGRMFIQPLNAHENILPNIKLTVDDNVFFVIIDAVNLFLSS